MSVAAKLVRNSVYSGAARLWNAGTTFIIMPYMFRRMGPNGYGVYQLLVPLLGFFIFADAGMSTAIPKYVSEYAAKEDNESLSDVVNTGVAFYALIAIVGMVIAAVFSRPYLRLINTPAEMMPEAMLSMRWIIAVTGLTFFVIAFRGILIGLQRVDISNVIEVVVSVPILFATIWVLYTGKGLLGMAIVQCSQYTLIGLAIIFYAVRLLPLTRVNPFRGSRETFRQLMSFGARVACPSIALLAQGQAERLMLASFLGPPAVGLYTFGQKVVDAWKVTFYPGLAAIVPAASHLDAVDASETVRALYERGTKFVLAIVYPTAAWLFVITPIFITVWMGPDEYGAHRGYSMMALRLVLIGASLQLTTGVAMSVARGLGRLKPDLIASPVLVFVEISVGIYMGRRWGFNGILFAGVLAFFANAVSSIGLVHRSFGWPLLPAFFKLYLPPLAVCAVVGAPLYYYNHIHRLQIVSHGSLVQRVELCFLGGIETIIFAVLYVVLIRLVKYVTPAEMQSLMRAGRGLGKLRG